MNSKPDWLPRKHRPLLSLEERIGFSGNGAGYTVPRTETAHCSPSTEQAKAQGLAGTLDGNSYICMNLPANINGY